MSNFFALKQKMKAQGLIYRKQGKDCVLFHNKNETMEHFVIKSMIALILKKRDRIIFTEYGFPNGAITDVFDFTNKRCYEVESKKDHFWEKELLYEGRDMFIVFVEDLGGDMNDWYAKLQKVII